jgi:hypothetical protein
MRPRGERSSITSGLENDGGQFPTQYETPLELRGLSIQFHLNKPGYQLLRIDPHFTGGSKSAGFES